MRNRVYSSVQAHSGGEVWTKALPDGNTVAVRIDPANPRSPSHYADAVPHAHIETVPTSWQAIWDAEIAPQMEALIKKPGYSM
ncbi:hypothetical protein A9R55_12035 [Escherichia coli]|nr:hypothetical protein A9R52_00230 [Escherichia coli]OEI35814.1 hypothetical protein A9R55_12035 [Escherichia coli]OEI43267.1 hypothetical protein A9R54_23240 [Escherichia coli]OEI56705.1 hypothetical protein A9R53_02985 [Escherichia coli]